MTRPTQVAIRFKWLYATFYVFTTPVAIANAKMAQC